MPVAALPPCLLPALREEGAQVSLATGAPVVADQIAIQPLQLRERIIGEVVQQILHINGRWPQPLSGPPDFLPPGNPQGHS